jgi:hypothetical protein
LSTIISPSLLTPESFPDVPEALARTRVPVVLGDIWKTEIVAERVARIRKGVVRRGVVASRRLAIVEYSRDLELANQDAVVEHFRRERRAAETLGGQVNWGLLLPQSLQAFEF